MASPRKRLTLTEEFDLVQRQKCMNGDGCKTWGCLYDHGTKSRTAGSWEHPQVCVFRREGLEKFVREVVAEVKKKGYAIAGPAAPRWALTVVRRYVHSTLGKEGGNSNKGDPVILWMPDGIGRQIVHDIVVDSGVGKKEAAPLGDFVRKALQRCSLEVDKRAKGIPNKNRVSDTCMRLTLRGPDVSYRGMSVSVPSGLEDMYCATDDPKFEFRLLRMWNIACAYHLLGDAAALPPGVAGLMPEGTQECFTSPLSRSMGPYNSILGDSDAFFGSHGSFFLQGVRQGSYYLDPVGGHNGVKTVAVKMQRALAAADRGLSFVVLADESHDPFFADGDEHVGLISPYVRRRCKVKGGRTVTVAQNDIGVFQYPLDEGRVEEIARLLGGTGKGEMEFDAKGFGSPDVWG